MPRMKHFRVLVLDDVQALRAIFKCFLSRAGWEVVTAANGDTALKIFRKRGPFDVVTTDVCHKGLSAFLLIKALRRKNPKQRVVLITADNGCAKQAARLKVPVLYKPFESEQLVEACSVKRSKR